jgi:hypothetical protein
VLHFDRSADGDLTGPGERFEGKQDGDRMTFEIGRFTDPVTKQEQTDVEVGRVEGEDARTMFRMKWCGKEVVRGGYAPDPGPYTQFAKSPADAPVLWPGADGPFGFQAWTLDKFPVGEATELRVFLGHPGGTAGTRSVWSPTHSCPRRCRCWPPWSTQTKTGKNDRPRPSFGSGVEGFSATAPCGSHQIAMDANAVAL